MPEIKHNFTGGKMNKDVDQRLVPKGEYRDAMNIQVSTSEGSDVGTVQNILGNKLVDDLSFLSSNSTCVGAIADEKNDAFYWLIADEEGYALPSFTSSSPQPFTKKDAIVQYKNGVVTPVFIDIAMLAYTIYQTGGNITWDSAAGTITFPNASFAQSISVGMNIHVDSSMLMIVANTGTITVTGVNGAVITVDGDLSWLDTNVTGQQAFHQTILVFKSGGGASVGRTGVLNFNSERVITGVNIIDDLLFWTDGETEPKKINILRSIEGTDNEGFKHTRLIVKGVDKGLIKEDHITVIKKGPSIAPTISKVVSRGAEGLTTIDFVGGNGSLLSVGDSMSIQLDNMDNIEEGDILRLHPDLDDTGGPPENYVARVLINSITDVSGVVVLDVNILTLSTTITIGSVIYKFAVEDDTKILFERKFPRFACRYKYEDNEYSPISPFSEVVFVPGRFDYHPTEAFNKGMINTLKELTLKDFIQTDMPSDVVQVDLLYKNEGSPNVYVIKSISKDDTLEEDGLNAWTSPGTQNGLYGSYNITTENMYGQLPSNQMLRPWDNVPKTASAQEVTGNRVVYGNYTQGYDLKEPVITTELKLRSRSDESFGVKSIKSLRTYNTGIVYGDEYGRETPVFTGPKAHQLVPKTQAPYANQLAVSIGSEHPEWADYYKVYIKETSNEYYNLAMDRLYDAEDGNIWISFPSVDRNKVDEDTYLILKKGIDDKGAVETRARYKIVAIENEVPDYLKTTYTKLAEPNLPISGYSIIGGSTSSGTPAGSGAFTITPPEEAPFPGHSSFTIRKSLWRDPYDTANSKMGLTTPLDIFADKGADKIYVSFSNNVLVSAAGVTPAVFEKKESGKYLVTGVKDPTIAPPQTGLYLIQLGKPISNNDSWITDNIADNFEVGGQLRPIFWKEETLDLAEFDGRFFVKIIGDELTRDNLLPDKKIDADLTIDAFTDFYYLADSDSGAIGTTNHPTSQSEDDWEDNLKFGGGNVRRKWFIDKTAYAAEQLPGTYNIRWAEGIFDTVPSHDPATGYSTGDVFREGYGAAGDVVAGSVSDHNFFTLSYSKLGDYFEWPDIPMQNPTTPKNWVPSDGFFPSWTAGSSEASKELIVEKLKIGQKFRFTTDINTIYTIAGVHKRRLYNHSVLPSDAVGGSVNGVFDFWGRGKNKRVSYTIKYTIDTAGGDDVPTNLGLSNVSGGIDNANPGMIEFVRPYSSGDPNTISTNPAVFETEPKEDPDIDVYYEASNKIPTTITDKTKRLLISTGDTLSLESGGGGIPQGTFVTGWNGTAVSLSNNILFSDVNGDIKLRFTRDDGSYVVVRYNGGPLSGVNPTTINEMEVSLVNQVGLAWYNCWSFGNGVESNRIGDTFNKPHLTNGAKVSTILDEALEEERKKYGLIYSGIYNSTSGINNLNQFIAAEKITKDINPIYGSIQKLYAGWGQGGDLIALCEDRILKILANKDALYNADGNTNVTSTNNVLGQAIPYSGEYGISKNPESFASEAYRVYFTDKVRGTVMRLSMDGLTPISNHGMKDWFRDNLKLSNKLVGSYDDKKDEYNITIKGDTIAKTVTFKEDVKGWVSFKSFTPENAISCANEYYTFLDGRAWKHHDETKPRNTFYDYDLAPSTLEVVFNEVPGSVKSFKTINYEGSQAKVTSKDENGVTFMDGEYFNLSDVDGWYVENIVTNLEQGGITEFVNKEGKWFGYVTGNDVTHNLNGDVSGNYYTEDFSIQGVGRTISAVNSTVFGCTNANAYNYNPAANQDDGSCVAVVSGCLDPNAFNYYAGANTDDGTCVYLGCTTGPLADWNNQNAGGSINYDPNATQDDGSCITAVFGCTDSTMFNYNNLANVGTAILGDGTNCGYENCACIPVVYGCTDSNADNYITLVDAMQDVNTDDGSCIYNGCTDPYADNYSFTDPTTAPPGWDGIVGVNIGGSISYVWLNGTAVDDGSCTYPGGCTDSTACNYDSTPGMVDNGSCQYCGDNDAVNYDGAQDTSCTTNCTYCEQPVPLTISAQATSDANMNNGSVTLEWAKSTSATIQYYEITINNVNPINVNPSGNATETHTINNLAPGTYDFQVIARCTQTSALGTVSATPIFIQTHITVTPILGCTDYGQTYYGGVTNPAGGTWGACNYNSLATQDDGSCEYTTCIGCNDPLYIEYCGDCWDTINQVVVASGGSNWVADTIPTSCLTLIVYGCTDATAFNYNSLATADDGSCVPVVLGCMDSTLNNNGTYAASNYAGPGSGVIPEANTDDGSCLPYTCPIISTENINNMTGVGGAAFAFAVNSQPTPYSKSPTEVQSEWATGTLGFTADVTVSGSNGSWSGTTNSIGATNWLNHYSNSLVVIGSKKRIQPQSNFWIAGDTTVTVDFNLYTNDGNCTLTDTNTYSIGCTDNAAANTGAYDITDDSQCVYSGCTDSTPSVMNSSANAATNYDANATVSCGTNNNNECCTYHDDQDVSASGFLATGDWMVQLAYEPVSTGYTEAVFSSLTLGEAPGTAHTVTNVFPKINMTSSLNDRIAAQLIPAIWETYVYNNNLRITLNADFNGACDNDFLNDQLPTGSVNKTFNFSVGCKDDNTAINYDPNVDLGMASTCIAANPGCMDSTATNYGAAFNQDCTFNGSANPNDCCCYTCGIPTFDATNPVIVNTWNDPSSPAYATQITFNFAAVSTAASYVIFVDGGSTALIPVVSPTINNGIVSYTFNTTFATFQNESTYNFKVRVLCENNDGDSCGYSDSADINILLKN